jgi:hypothetical protein
MRWRSHLSGPCSADRPQHFRPHDGKRERPVATTIGEASTWLDQWLSSEAAFVSRLVSQLPDAPPNFAKIAEFNERGELPSGDVTNLEAGATRCAIS